MKRIQAKIDTYQNDQGETKGKWVEIGVIMQNDQGQEYALINPTVDLSGVMIRQRMMNPDKAGKGVIASIFEDRPQQNYQPPAQNQGAAKEFDDGDIPF